MADPVVYPLYWPDNQPRTKEHAQVPFPGNKWSIHAVWPSLMGEVDKLCPMAVVVSTCCPWSNREGRPLSGNPDDCGAAFWFKRKKDGPWLCIACDKFDTVGGNLRAIQLIIEGRRREERYGTTAMIESAWSAFEVKSLPATLTEPWHIVLGVAADCPVEVAEAAYRTLAKKAHPDVGGSQAAMARLNHAVEEARTTARQGKEVL